MSSLAVLCWHKDDSNQQLGDYTHCFWCFIPKLLVVRTYIFGSYYYYPSLARATSLSKPPTSEPS